MGEKKVRSSWRAKGKGAGDVHLPHEEERRLPESLWGGGRGRILGVST